MKLVGKQMVNFVSRDTGEEVKGIKLHYLCSDNNVSGHAAATQFIRADNPCYEKAVNIPLGEFSITYGRKGSVEDIVSLEK